VAGDDAELIAYTLKHAGLISDPTRFIRRVQALQAESQLQAGTYTIPGGTSIDEIIEILKKGPGIQGTPLLVPEGASIAYIASSVEEVTGGRVTAADFLAAAQASRWVGEFAFAAEAGEASLEGMLFPATYGISDTDTADDIIRMMLTKFKSVIAGLEMSFPESKGLTWYEWLKLASIVEREGGGHGDEKGIASVFFNRLDAGMPQQSDATTAYAVGGVPTPEQLADKDDPYNTYERTGVSIPTPIGNPGLAAMEATCHPDSTDYFYFYAKTNKDGSITMIFSRTYEEHLAAIESDR
ncbi:MAG: endolytic transglycosylase MltG, partial [Eggerthellaceae bacterium]|nr:endolytic transglycosylase MltG [Eggerthellaceae bacterium]